VGVIFSDLVPSDFLQMNTLTTLPNNHKKRTDFIKTIDKVNNKYGRYTLSFAATGTKQPWKVQQSKKSACFTTNWHELLTITI